MNKNKALVDLKASVSILESNIRLFHEGTTATYRSISVLLRLLLCDKKPLLTRIFPNLKLHPLRGGITKEMEEDYIKDRVFLYIHAKIRLDTKDGVKIIELFDESREPIELTEWLDQSLFKQKITIKELIKSVADTEGAHSDPNYNNTLNYTRSIKLDNEAIHIKYIIAIGEYILKWLKMASKIMIPFQNYG